ncbi:hypothetical protein C9374_003310 [Naegleria lovaniensis]|uniref:PUB domain-containing protein n=1 Tax=Naegleria lovaniensis TaxID=51637 RepID=A0AA88KJC7_NAELO|nr:uncharacterized protein C9374_003310 [Naegleria lovaniensis]KAG2385495.1 hypothetical protein C9374_003310 [Naegleria lovaniensis]
MISNSLSENVAGFVAHKVHQTFKLNPNLTQKKDSLTLVKNIMMNVIKNFFDEKYRKIKMSNQKFSEKVVNVPGAFDLLLHSGFRTDGENAYLPSDVKVEVLDFVISIIEGYEQGKFVVSTERSSVLNSVESTLKLNDLINASEKLKSDPSNLEYRLAYAKAAEDVKQADLYDHCIQMLTESIENIVSNKIRDDLSMYKLYYRIASLHYSKGNLDTSLENVKLCEQLMAQCNDLVFGDNDYGLLHHLCACIYATKKQIPEAVAEFDKALKYNYELRDNTLRQKGNTLATHYLDTFMKDNTNFEECVQGLLHLLNTDCPEHESILLVLGIIHQRNGSVEGAIKYYNELLERPDRDVDGVMQSKVS